MVPTAGSPRTVIIVKRRGSKRHAAEGEDWENSRRDPGDPARTADDSYADPARGELAPATAQ
jgi:hypothetical protein